MRHSDGRGVCALVLTLVAIAGGCANGTVSAPEYRLQVVETSPAADAVGVSPASVVTARFSEPVDAATLAGGFTLAGVAGSVIYDPATLTATLTPATPLDWSAPYTATIATSVVAASGHTLAAPVVWTFTVADDPTPFHVEAVTPADGGTLPRTGVITARFSRPVDPGTLTAATFSITGVAGAVTYDATTRTATFTPGAALAYDTSYTARVEATVTDTSGDALAAAHLWSFTTLPDTDPPAIETLSPAADETGVPLDAIIAATFTEDMAPASLDQTTVTLQTAGGDVVPVTVTYETGSRVVTLGHAELSVETTYVATLSGATDLAGNALPVTTWSFDTIAISPAIVAFDPPDGARAVSWVAAHPLVVAFSEPMAPGTLAGALSLTAAGVAVPGSVSWDEARLEASFAPDADLLPDTTYDFAVATTATDLAGNALAASASVQFRTAGLPRELSAPGLASQVKPAVAIGTSGDALAAWFVDTGTGSLLLASRYDAATGLWSTEELLEAAPTTRPASGGVSVVATDTGYAVVWSSPAGGLAALRLGPAGWSSIETIDPAPAAAARWQVATDGESIAVAWTDGTTANGWVRIHDGTTWRPTGNLGTGRFDIAGCPTGIAVLSIDTTTTSGTGYSIWLDEWRRDLGGWSTAHSLGYQGSPSYRAIPLDLVTNGRAYMALWDEVYTSDYSWTSHTLRAAEVGDDAPAGAPIQSITNQTSQGYFLWTASDGSGYAVAWDYVDSDVSPSTYTLETATFASGVWTTSSLPPTTELVDGFGLASTGSGYALAWTTSTSSAKLYAALGSGGTWGTPALIDQGTNRTSIPDGKLARSGTEYVLAYAVDGVAKAADSSLGAWTVRTTGSGTTASSPALASREGHAIPYWIEGAAISASALGPAGWETATLAQRTYRGSVMQATVARGASGTLVAWLQYDVGKRVAYASVGTDGIWSEPLQLRGPYDSNGIDAVARGSSLLVTWAESSAIFVRIYDGTGWGEAASILPPGYGGGLPQIAANTSEYVIAYGGSSVESTSSADGITWSVPVGQSSPGYNQWTVACGASGCALLMRYPSTGAVQQTTFVGTAWTTTTNLTPATAMGALATDDGSFVWAWPSASGVSVSRFDGTAWSMPAVLGAGTAPATVGLADGYMVTWSGGDGSPMYSAYSQGAWSEAAAMPTGGAVPAKLARAGSTVAAIGIESQTGAVSRSFASGAWSATSPLEPATGPVTLVDVASDGTSFVMAWGRTAWGTANRCLFVTDGM